MYELHVGGAQRTALVLIKYLITICLLISHYAAIGKKIQL